MKLYDITFTLTECDSDEMQMQFESEDPLTRDDLQALLDDWVRKNVTGVILSHEEVPGRCSHTQELPYCGRLGCEGEKL